MQITRKRSKSSPPPTPHKTPKNSKEIITKNVQRLFQTDATVVIRRKKTLRRSLHFRNLHQNARQLGDWLWLTAESNGEEFFCKICNTSERPHLVKKKKKKFRSTGGAPLHPKKIFFIKTFTRHRERKRIEGNEMRRDKSKER